MDFRMTELSDEMLMHVFQFVPSMDLIAVSKTCRRFQKVCGEKRVVNPADFSGCPRLTVGVLDEFLRSRCGNVTELNLNGCSWLPWPQIGTMVRRLGNLKKLHVKDCDLSLVDLAGFVDDVFELDELSLSMSMCRVGRLGPDEPMRFISNVKTLKVDVSSPYDLDRIGPLLVRTPNLEFLEIGERESCLATQSYENFNVMSSFLGKSSFPCWLPKLRQYRFILGGETSGYSIERLAYKMLKVAHANPQCFWSYQGGCFTLNRLCKEGASSVGSLAASMVSLSLNCTTMVEGAWQIDRSDQNGVAAKFAKQVLGHGCLDKCVHLSLDFQRLDKDMLCAVAEHCKNLQLLDMCNCHIQQQLSQLQYGLNAIGDSCRYLTTINLVKTHFHQIDPGKVSTRVGTQLEACSFLTKMKGLQSLSLPTCLLTNEEDWNRSFIVKPSEFRACSGRNPDWQSTVREGVSNSSNEIQIPSQLLSIVESCTKLKKLMIHTDLGSRSCQKISSNIADCHLQCIDRLQELEVLTISNLLGIGRGNFLNGVSKNCKRLRNLNLRNLGIKDMFSYRSELLEALPLCTNLRDFRLDQKNVSLNYEMLETFVRCRNLERLSIHTEELTHPITYLKAVELITHLPNLSALNYIDFSAGGESCNLLQEELMSYFLPDRPGLSVNIILGHPIIQSYRNITGLNIPIKDVEDLVRYRYNTS